MDNPRIIDLFAGIGGIRLGFESHGCECVFSSEWDKHAQDTYEANFGERPHGDITKIEPNTIPDHDILLGGFPCQAFSICGDRKGFSDTRGTLFFNIEEILKAKKPYAFMLENVKNLRSHDGGRTFKTILSRLEELGYFIHHTVLNSLDFGIPQKRERTIIVGFRDNLSFSFPKPLGLKPDLSKIIEDDKHVDDKYYASEDIRRKRLEKVKANYPTPSIWHENKSGNISALEYSCALRAGASYNYLLINGVRRPTPRELLRLQGFPDTFKIVVPYTQLRKQAGNSVSVPVMRAVAQEMLESIRQKKPAKQNVQSFNLWGEECLGSCITKGGMKMSEINGRVSLIIGLILLGIIVAIPFIFKVETTRDASAYAVPELPLTECQEDIECMDLKHQKYVVHECKKVVESDLKTNYRWTKADPKDIFRRKIFDKYDNSIIVYTGDALQVRNSYGDWVRHTYVCLYDTKIRAIKDSGLFAGGIED